MPHEPRPIDEAFLRSIAPRLSPGHRRHDRQNHIIKEVAAHLDRYFDQFGLATIDQRADFISQVMHESDGMQTTEEYASGKAYEGRQDLGNTEPGDGMKFKGHGLIQTTGRYNHGQFNDWAKRNFEESPDFISEPHRLTAFPWALASAFFYWDQHGLKNVSDFRALTKKINGGHNGLADRRKYRARVIAAYNGEFAASLLQLGSRGSDVLELQTRLKQVNFNPGPLDGDFGGGTESATRDFQSEWGLVVDGKVIVGGETWKALDEAIRENYVKDLPAARVKATGDDLKDSRIVAASDEANGATILTGAGGLAAQYADKLPAGIGDYLTTGNVTLALSLALNVYLISRLVKARNARIDDHRKGKTK